MKKTNLILFVVLMLALGLTYLLIEKRNLDKSLSEDREAKILNFDKLGDIKRFTTQKADIVKEGDLFFMRESRYPVNGKRLDEVFSVLSNIKNKSLVPATEVQRVGKKFYIPDEQMKLGFYFENETVYFILGKKLDFDQSFYMEVVRESNQGAESALIIAYDSSPDSGVYQSDEEMQKSDAKYRRLQAIFYLGESYYNDLRIFKERYTEESITFKEVSIATFRNKKFSINFEKTKTNPEAPKGVKYFDDNWIEFYRNFIQLTANGIMLSYKKELLKEPLSQVVITDRDNKTEELTLYRKYGSLNGYFLVSSLERALLELEREKAQYFLLNVQDFWDKKIEIPGKTFELSLFDQKRVNIAKMMVRDLELFRAEKLMGNEPDNINVKKLVDLLKANANHLSIVEKSDQELVKKARFYFALNKKLYSVIYEDSLLILLDQELNIMYHYYVGSETPIELDPHRYSK